ncbi:hypothetical protein ANTRET_LOCUS4686 [Anthophora retusa]
MMFATATFEVNSVTVSANKQTMNNMASGLIDCKAVRAFPRMVESLELVLPAEMANPPPRTKIKLQCIFWCIIFHVIMPGDGLVGRFTGSGLNDRRKSSFDGNMKKRMVTQAAAVESLTCLESAVYIVGMFLFRREVQGKIIAETYEMCDTYKSVIYVGQPRANPGLLKNQSSTTITKRIPTLDSCHVIGPSSLYFFSITAAVTFSPCVPISMARASLLSGLNIPMYIT